MVNLNILKSSKEEIEIEIDSLTIAEILKVYLNKDTEVTLAVWKREHPTKNPIFLVRTKGKSAKKAVIDATEDIIKELDKVLDNFKKGK